MKNRTDEYWALMNELSQPPKELEGSIDRARKRAKRSGLARRMAAPAASFAAAAAAFVLMVNVFPTFALACSGVPIIRELTAAVAFSPSLSTAVAHDYVQYIGQSQTVDGVTLHLEYGIVDREQAVFFYRTDGNARFHTSPNILNADGEDIGGYAVSVSGYGVDKQDGLESMTISLTGGNALPDRFILEMFLRPQPEQNQAEAVAAPEAFFAGELPEDTDPRKDPGVLRFTFDVSLDPSRICEPKTVEVGRWVELDGQRFLVDRLELAPTRTVLYLEEDAANTAWLGSLKFHFEDGKGRVYDTTDNTLSASGREDTKSYLTYYFQSFYFDPPKGLTLCIDRAQWLDKDAPRVKIDLAAGTAVNLPSGMELGEIQRRGSNVTIKFLTEPGQGSMGQSLGNPYWDPEGKEHYWNMYSGGTDWEAGSDFETYYLEDYSYDTVEFSLLSTGVTQYDPPVRMALF